jgi:F0F1-type ATP synthase membrane subunit b/b'
MALAVQLIPNAIENIINVLQKRASKIRDTVTKVKANKYQCARLSERIDIVVSFIQRESSTTMS